MRILVINWQDRTNPLSGGAEVHLHETFSRIVAMGHEVTLFCSGYAGAAAEEMVDGIRVIRRGQRNTFNFGVPGHYRALSGKARGGKFDVVVDDMNKIPFFTPLYVREPLVGICHHFFGRSIFREAGPVAGSYVYLAEALATAVYRHVPFLAVSQSTLEEMVERGFPRANLALAMNAIDPRRLHPTGVPKSKHATVGYFGRLKKYKSVDHVVRAFAEVRQAIPAAELVIIGQGDDQPRLERLARELGVAGATRFTGFVAEEEKRRLLTELWVVVNPSMKEGWGIVNVEANACGTPAIAADSPGLRDSVQHGVTGMLYPYGDVALLAQQLIRVLEDAPLRNTLGANAQRFASSLSWDETAAATIRFLARAVERRLA
jgi:glycosyltransferase involved in cell wall biosynthesis